MKSIIFVLLIYYSFCQIYELQKFGTIKTTSYNGIVYLNTEDFEIDDIIHIQFNAVNGNMNSIIYYQFYHTEPNSTFYPSKNMDASNQASSKTKSLGKVTITKEYYYDIKKEDGKYLIIAYSAFKLSSHNGYLEIEHTRVNWAITIIILMISFFVLFLIFFVVIYIKKKR